MLPADHEAPLEQESHDLEDSLTGSVVHLNDFWYVGPQAQFIYTPSMKLWPTTAVEAQFGKKIADGIKSGRTLVDLTWHPGEPMFISDKLVDGGGWVHHAGVKIINLYRPPAGIGGDASMAARWIDHIRLIYPDDADHVIRWLAQRIQQPGVKINHALVLGGAQGIGKDTILHPVVHGVGPWNTEEIAPSTMMGRFNGWAKSVLLRISEARDLGDVDRYAFYERSKTVIAAPPDTIRCDEKNLREHHVFNVCGVVFTTNNKTSGMYLPLDDRRHYVAWSDVTRDAFGPNYWTDFWAWYDDGGVGHVVAYLRSLDVSTFDPKAPPAQTEAWRAIVDSNMAPEDSELADVIDRLGHPPVLTIEEVAADDVAFGGGALAGFLRDRKNARQIAHRMESAGYVKVMRPGTKDGAWMIKSKRTVIYGTKGMDLRGRTHAADMLAAVRNR